EQKFEQSKHAVSEKASEAKAKGAGILGATHHALATGAAIVSEKVKHGIESSIQSITQTCSLLQMTGHEIITSLIKAIQTEEKVEESKHAINEKTSEAKAKGAGILGATHHALATGAAIVSEKVKHGIELASGAVSHSKSHESEKQVEHKLESAEKIAEHKTEETKQMVSEKASDAKAKGTEILGATQHALSTGAAVVTEKAKHGVELASGAASNVKAATGQLAGDAQTKVVETAHSAQAKASELLTTVETKAADAASAIAAKTVEAKNTTVAAAQTAASTIQEKTSALLDSGKQVLTSSTASQPAPIVSSGTDHISQEAYVTQTSGQTAHGPDPITAEQVAPTTAKASKGGPIAAIRNFFSRLFGSSHRHEEQRRVNTNVATNAAGQTTETTTTVATSNPPILS
ncbi:unnamed protein product, partial [Rotaria sp. Silwood1]